MLACIPQPRVIETLPGALAVSNLALVYLPGDSTALDFAAAQLVRDELCRINGRSLPISRAWRPPVTRDVIAIGSPQTLTATFGNALPPLPTLASDPEAYAVIVTSDGVFLMGVTAQARMWAAQTFRQLLHLHGNPVPNVRINDTPSMRYRGVLLDVSRRKVPQVATLKSLVDTLSLFKINMFQLQVEHTFQWQRHPHIGEGCGSLSCEDIMELDAHCKLRGVELVPMLQSFAHMRNVLMLDEYRHLAENPAFQWSLCPTDPESLQFMDELYEEYLFAYSSDLVNIGCDETFELGCKGGRSNAAISKIGKGRVYVNFLLSLHRLLTEKYGKRVMCWGDVVLNHPELIPELPEDLIMLNWWYDPKDRYDQVDAFEQHNLSQIVCPGTNSWNSIFPRGDMAWANISTFTRDGKSVGALGMLNTDWGDGGHYNLLGCSYYSYAHGADASWAAQPLSRANFEAMLGPVLFGPHGEEVVAAFRELGTVCDYPQYGNLTMDMLFNTPLESEKLHDLPREVPHQLAAMAIEAGDIFHNAELVSLSSSAVADMAWAADAVAYAARKTDFCFSVMDLAAGVGGGRIDKLINLCEDLLAEHEATMAAFRERWFSGNRHSEIDVALGKMEHAYLVMQTIHRWLQENSRVFALDKQVPLPELPKYNPPWKEDHRIFWSPEYAEA